MKPDMKSYLKDRPCASSAVEIAEQIGKSPMTTDQGQVSTLVMIPWAILDHSDAVRELTAALEQRSEG